jgi:natural product precursor
MKNLSKIKLNQFSKDELERRKMNALKGGCECYRSCDCSGIHSALDSFGATPGTPTYYY